MSSLNWENGEELNLVPKNGLEIPRALKAGCNGLKNNTILLKLVATELLKTDKIKMYC